VCCGDGVVHHDFGVLARVRKITDKDFLYVPADKTDVRKTFARVRKEQEEERERLRQEAAARLKNVISNRRFK
jgi:hypothetical protein